MKGKKAIATLLIAVFIISTLAIALPVSAVDDVYLLDPATWVDPDGPWDYIEEGPVGTEVVVVCSTDSPFTFVEIFWDSPVGEKLGEGYADDDYYMWIDIVIPEDTVGDHYVIGVGERYTYYAVFTITPEIVLTPASALPGDLVAVAGTGFAEESDIGIFFDSDPANLITEGDATAEWSTNYYNSGDYSVELTAGTVDWVDWAGVQIPVGEELQDMSSTHADYGFYYRTDGTTSQTPAVAFVFYDVEYTGGETWKLVEYFTSLDTSVTTWTSEVLKPELFLMKGSTNLGTAEYWTTTGWAPNMGGLIYQDLTAWWTTYVYGYLRYRTVDCVEVSIGARTGTVYVDDITVDGVTSALEANLAESVTGPLGSFEASFTVPDVIYNPYDVTAVDAYCNFNTTEFEVTATVTLIPDEGPTGTIVNVVGDGFLGTEVNVTFAAGTPYEVYMKNDIPLTLEAFATSFRVPTVPVGIYTIIANSTLTKATAEFNVTGTTWIGLTPVAGTSDTEVTIEGLYFSANAEVTVDFDVPYPAYATFPTNSTGGFKGTFTAPSLPEADYTITATDENDLTATANFQIAITLIVLVPDKGPTGLEVSVISYGFTDAATADVYFDSILVVNDISTAALATFTVPTVPIGTYTVTYEDSEGLISSDDFEVTDTTRVELDPVVAPNLYNVTIEGWNFADEATPLDFVLYNATPYSLPLMVVYQTLPVLTDIDGNFTGYWQVPDVLSIGDYMMNITDGELFAQVPFSVVEVYREIYPLLTQYEPGETVNFHVSSTFTFALNIEIVDPIGYEFDAFAALVPSDWIQVGDYWTVPYAAFFDLPSNAIAGTWNWTAFDVTEEVVKGTFTVGEAPEPEPELPAETTGEEILDSMGSPKTSFVLGEMVLVSADITNVGTQSQPVMMVVQLTDPMLSVLAPSFSFQTLTPGQLVEPSWGFILPMTGYTTGTWTAKVMVFDTWPALGGVPIGLPVTITFTVS